VRHLTSEELSAHWDRALTGRRAEEAERHLAACEECREALAALASQDATLRPALTHDPGEAYFEAFAGRVARRIAAPQRTKAGWGFGRLFDSPRTLAWVSAAAVLVVGAGVVLMTQREVVPPDLRDRELAGRAHPAEPASPKEAEAPAETESRLRNAAPAPAVGGLKQDFAAPPRDDDAVRARQEGAGAGATASEEGRLPSRADQPLDGRPESEKDKGAPSTSVGGKREGAEIVPRSRQAGAANELKTFAAAPAAPAPAAPGRAIEVRRNAAGEEVPVRPPVATPSRPSVTTPDELAKVRKKLEAEPLRDAFERETKGAVSSDGRKPATAALGETPLAPEGAAKSQALPAAPLASSAPSGSVPSLQRPAESGRAAVAGEARKCGVVLDAAGRPVAGAQVALADLGRVTATDGAGHFCLDAPAGEHTLSVMAVGFAPRRQTLRFGGEPVSARIVLDAVPVLEQKRPLPQRVPPRMPMRPAPAPSREESTTLQIIVPAFAPNGPIPAKYTCDGEDVSPALAWIGFPPGTRSLVLIVDDPDAPDPAAPKMTWVHWVLYNLPPSASGLPEHATGRALPGHTREGLNDWKQPGWRGPCPPKGRHRYFFKLYALDTTIAIPGADKGMVTRAMEGHVLGHTEQVGTYAKK